MPEGYVRQSEPVQSDDAPELRRKMYRRWGNEAVTVERADFLTQEEAAQTLGRLGVGLLLARRILRPAFLEDGSEGVTRESVEAELEWQASAGPIRKVRRAIGGFLHFL